MYCYGAFSPIPFIFYAALIALALAGAAVWVYSVANDNGWQDGFHDGYRQRMADEQEEALHDWSSQRQPAGGDRHAAR